MTNTDTPIAADTPKKRSPRKKKTPVSDAPAPAENPVSDKDIQTSRKNVPEPFIKDLKGFSEILEANPGIIEPIRDVFDYHLADTIDRKTFPKIVNAMSMLLGGDATMVLMTACHVNAAAFFEDLLAEVKDDEKAQNAVWMIQHLTALYGNRIQQAYTLSSGTMDEDWHTIDVNTYRREGENPVWIVDVNLMLYSGIKSHIKMTPDSAYQLLDIIMAELAQHVPKEQIDDGLVRKCKENATAFFEKFYGSQTDDKPAEDHPAGYA